MNRPWNIPACCPAIQWPSYTDTHDIQMQAVGTVCGEHVTVHEMIRDWRTAIDSFSHRCVLVFDLYYFSADSVNILEKPSASSRPSCVK